MSNNAELSEAVRSWVHFDNLAESLNKQVANVRNLRNQFETKILEIMDRMGLQNASLKITGAVLQRAQRSKQSDLTWSFLEEQLHEYYKTSGARGDETAKIMAFLQTHRGTKSVEYLKKTSVAPANTHARTATGTNTASNTVAAAAGSSAAAAATPNKLTTELRNKVVP